MYKEDLALNNLQWLMCHENQPTISPILMSDLSLVSFEFLTVRIIE